MLKADASTFIKTLIYVADEKPVAVLIRGDHEANEGKIRRALGATDLELADEATIEQVTGAPVGFAGPVGIKCSFIADHDIAAISSAITGANEKDKHLTGVVPGTHFDLTETFDLRNAAADDPCPKCSARLWKSSTASKLGTSLSLAPSTASHSTPVIWTKKKNVTPSSWAATASESLELSRPSSKPVTTTTALSGRFPSHRTPWN